MAKLLTVTDLARRFGTRYRVGKLVKQGILAPPLPRASGQEAKLWLEADAIAAERTLEEMRQHERREAEKTTVTLRTNTARRIRTVGLARGL